MKSLEFSTFISTSDSVLQSIAIADTHPHVPTIYIKRDDLLHPEVSGNKWRKLHLNLLQAVQMGNDGVLTFGGAFSNHLLATAAACNAFGLRSVGIVRGEELNATSNPTLKRCKELDMDLHFVSREEYAMRSDKQYVDELRLEFPSCYPVPEGGANYYGMMGCQQIWKELPNDCDHLFVACGTGTTVAGLLLGCPEHCTVHVIPVLKGFETMETLRKHLYWAVFDEELVGECLTRAEVHEGFHRGGYAKTDEDLLQKVKEIHTNFDLPLDYVYTAKAFLGMLVLLHQERFARKKCVFLHTGGLQGNQLLQSVI